MSNHVFLSRDYDLYISMTWAKNPERKHGTCGHIYEIFDYYLFLKQHYKVGILIGEHIDLTTYKLSIQDKYNLTDPEVEDIINNTTFVNRPKIITGKNILFVDGLLNQHFQQAGVILKFDNIFTFRCSPRSTHHDLDYRNVTLLQDQRVYNDQDSKIATDYVKKINFSKYKSISKTNTGTALLYGTGNCRKLELQDVNQIIDTYKYAHYMLVTNLVFDHQVSRLTVYDPPVENIFNLFDTYIYTPTTKVFDCSPRFIAECKFYGKDVVYHNIDREHLERNTGLDIRIKDVTSEFDSIHLKPGDTIIDIINEKL